ncbi:peptidase family M20/M25/M40 [Saccharata proteae CBS 121410]|uniref:Peptidase family M20/M25/M40 n=1 Tax=Saccharata proteae CBS 121410 TaxID=1314787 RepID=A0A9P4M050_9PEZI|nr:peptidase family M20/M25/M40 [Saccharata proteae CBS 121410]
MVQKPSSLRYRVVAGCLLLALSPFALWFPSPFRTHRGPSTPIASGDPAEILKNGCPQFEPLVPSYTSPSLEKMENFIDTPTFFNQSIQRLSAAVQIETQSFDDMGAIGSDPRWEVFYPFAAYLKATFPLIHSKLALDVVNTHGLIYTWHGTNATLKPTLLMAHQDVVPVPESTIPSWTHPPFAGHFDGEFIWGRGASDCKNQLIAIMTAVELLLATDFTPKRTLILSFGFDEEISGREGAGHLAPFLSQRYGPDSIAVIVDEGAGISTAWGTPFATPGVAEKGYIDVDVVVRMPGGHSSVPPDHNGIGVMSELITLIESNRYTPRLNTGNPYLGLLQCGAQHSPDFPPKLKDLLSTHHTQQCSAKDDPLALEASKQSPATKYLMTTSIAVDVITGGVKVNALPERTVATINHRVNVGEHPSLVRAKLTSLAATVAQKYNLSLHAFTGEADAETPSSITLTALDTELEPAPVTPTEVEGATPWSVLSGTTRGVYAAQDVIMAPGMSTGNTDTRYYWDLTRHIFRYGPGWDGVVGGGKGGLGNAHTVDERVSVGAHVNGVRWFGRFVRNMDEVVLE